MPIFIRKFVTPLIEKPIFMKKATILTVLALSFSLALISFATAAKDEPVKTSKLVSPVTDSSEMEEKEELLATASSLFNNLGLGKLGLSLKTVEYAVMGYHNLEEKGKVKNNYLTIIDMGQSSRKKRLYLIDMDKQQLVYNTFVSHGRNSGVDKATKFSNEPNSYATSLGFYITKNTYRGKHGLSLRLSGQERGFNHNAERRAIVMHGASYVNASRVNSSYMGRSLGCPALSMKDYAKVINYIKDGSVMFIYHPTKNYIQNSKLIEI